MPAEDDDDDAAVGTPRHSRPSAPPLFLNKGNGDGGDEDEAEKPDDDVPDDKLKCGSCGDLSPQAYRFCISCGSVLAKKAKKKAAPAKKRRESVDALKVSQKKTVESAKSAVVDEPVDQGKVVDVNEKPPAKALLSCDRCGGKCDAAEAFCKYCGAPLPKGSAAIAKDEDGKRKKAKKKSRRAIGRVEVRKARVNSKPKVPDIELDLSAPAGPLPQAQSKEQPAAGKNEATPTGRRRKVADVVGCLVVIVEDGSEGKALELTGQQIDIGGTEGDIVLSEDRYLSPRHARLYRKSNSWYLRDLESLNGVYRRLRKPRTLRDGDLVLLGLEVLQFQMVDHAERGLGHAMQHNVLVFGSPAATRRARLCQRTVEGIVRDVYHLLADETTVGREIGDIVFTSDPFMSRRHAAIRWRESDQEYVLTDLNSSNGTYLAIREDVRLEDGDFIRLGQHLFRVDLPNPREGQ